MNTLEPDFADLYDRLHSCQQAKDILQLCQHWQTHPLFKTFGLPLEQLHQFWQTTLKKSPQLDPLALLKDHLSIYLGQLLEVRWYHDYPVYHTDSDFKTDPVLYNLTNPNPQYTLLFSFKVLHEDLLNRGLRYLTRKLQNPATHPASATVGMKTTYCRPEMIAMLNELAHKIDRGQTQKQSAPLQVNSILRSGIHQEHLASLGYLALSKSTHTQGFAADIEKNWYQQFAPEQYQALESLLADYVEQGILNVIDEGHIWHICLRPAYLPHYQQCAQDWRI